MQIRDIKIGVLIPDPPPDTLLDTSPDSCRLSSGATNEDYLNLREDLTITMKALTSHLRHYAKWTLTPRQVDMKLGCQSNYHRGHAAKRHYAIQPCLMPV